METSTTTIIPTLNIKNNNLNIKSNNFNIKSIRDSPSRSESQNLTEKIESFQKQGDIYTKKIELEKRKNEALDEKIKRLKDHLYSTKKSLGGSNPSEGVGSKAKSIRTLENRLEKVLNKLNETCNSNKKLREEIQNLRREKIQQQQIRDKLDRELHIKKTEVQKAAEATQMEYESRDQAQRQIEAIRQQTAEEIMFFENEWHEMKEELEMERSLVKEQTNTRNFSNKNTSQAKPDTSLSSVQKEEIIKKKSNQAYWAISKKEVTLQQQTKKVHSYEDSFKRIQEETGVQSVEEMIDAFHTSESNNFSLFNMINDLNTEMEKLEVENAKLEDSIRSFSSQSSDLHRANMKKNLEEQILKCQETAQAYEERYEDAINAIESVKSGVMNIFHKVGYHDEGLVQQLTSTGVTEMNIMQFLGIIEQRINEVVQLHNMGNGSTEKTEIQEINTSLPIIKKSILSIQHQLPTTDEFAESDNEENEESIKPFSISELQDKTARTVLKQKERGKNKRNANERM